jgi:hypothetical protein
MVEVVPRHAQLAWSPGSVPIASLTHERALTGTTRTVQGVVTRVLARRTRGSHAIAVQYRSTNGGFVQLNKPMTVVRHQ